MTKFTLAFREIGTYKETLRSQVVILMLLLVLLLLCLFLPQFCTVILCCLLTIWNIFGKQSCCCFIVSSFYHLPYIINYWTLYALFYGINISCKGRLIREKVIDKQHFSSLYLLASTILCIYSFLDTSCEAIYIAYMELHLLRILEIEKTMQLLSSTILSIGNCLTDDASLTIFNWLCQVDHMLNDRLLNFVNDDLHEVKVLCVLNTWLID